MRCIRGTSHFHFCKSFFVYLSCLAVCGFIPLYKCRWTSNCKHNLVLLLVLTIIFCLIIRSNLCELEDICEISDTLDKLVSFFCCCCCKRSIFVCLLCTTLNVASQHNFPLNLIGSSFIRYCGELLIIIFSLECVWFEWTRQPEVYR